MGAADSQCKSVCSIFGFRGVGKAQERLNHFLNLGLARSAIADDSHFGLFRGVFVDGDVAAGCGEDHHPLSHAELDSALGVFQNKLRLDGNRVGAVFF
jgi:hypothetical protein